MWTTLEINADVFNKYLQIRQDIINNLKDVFNREQHYTRKYRGNMITDVNVSLNTTPDKLKEVQIFVRHRKKYIRERLRFNYKGVVESEIITNLYNDEQEGETRSIESLRREHQVRQS